MRLVVDLTLPIDTRLMSQTRRAVGGYLSEAGVAEHDVEDVVLALAEACTNVVRHSHLGDDDSFRLRTQVSDDEVVVIVEDDGVGIPPQSRTRAVDLEATSGRGLHLIRQLMTSVDLESAPERRGTRLQMRKSVKLQGAGLSGAG